MEMVVAIKSPRSLLSYYKLLIFITYTISILSEKFRDGADITLGKRLRSMGGF